MIFFILAGIVTLLLVLSIIKLLKNSYRFDKIVKSITEQQELRDPKTGEIINKLSAAEQALSNKAQQQKKEVDQLNRDNNVINEYLTNKGVTKSNDVEN